MAAGLELVDDVHGAEWPRRAVLAGCSVAARC